MRHLPALKAVPDPDTVGHIPALKADPGPDFVRHMLAMEAVTDPDNAIIQSPSDPNRSRKLVDKIRVTFMNPQASTGNITVLGQLL